MSIYTPNRFRRNRKRPPLEAHDPGEIALRGFPAKGPPAEGAGTSRVDEVDRGLYNNRPARMRAERIGAALTRFASLLMPRKVQDVILPNLTHRMEFEQAGRLPDMEECLEFTPYDGRYVARAAWMDAEGVGHVYLAWKERPVSVGAAVSANISNPNLSEGGKAP
jgi:hypothetical protein